MASGYSREMTFQSSLVVPCGLLLISALGLSDTVLAGDLPVLSPAGTILPGDPLDPDDQFGATIAADGDLCVISAPGDDTVAENAGCLYVFRFANGAWVQEAKLVDDAWSSGASLGTMLVVSDGVIASQSGDSVSCFMRSGEQWTLVVRYNTPCLTNIFADGQWWAIDRGCGSDRELLMLKATSTAMTTHSSCAVGEAVVGIAMTQYSSTPSIYSQGGYSYVSGFPELWGQNVFQITYNGSNWESNFLSGLCSRTQTWSTAVGCDCYCWSCDYSWSGSSGVSVHALMPRGADYWPVLFGSRSPWSFDGNYEEFFECEDGNPCWECWHCSRGGILNCGSNWIDVNPDVISSYHYINGQTIYLLLDDDPQSLASLSEFNTPGAIAAIGAIGTSGTGEVSWWDLGQLNDLDQDGLPNEDDLCPQTFDPTNSDCNANGIGDVCEEPVFCGTCSANSDCNLNGVADRCDLLDPTLDTDGNGLIDACECPDFAGPSGQPDGEVDQIDLFVLINTWGPGNGSSDINGDGYTNVYDLLLILNGWGPCA